MTATPWAAIDGIDAENNRLYRIEDSARHHIADAYDTETANLIIAAPELLAALERILLAHDSGNNGAVMGEAILCQQFAEQARAAIAKAKGE